jgi:acyl-CoA thioester hydrolase
MAFRHRLRVRYAECDPQGIVFNANYLLYVDVTFTELWRAAVGPWQEMVDSGYDCVVADVQLSFHAPARFDDEVDVTMDVERLGRSSIESALAFRRGEELLASGTLRHVVVSAESWSSVEMPAFIRDGLSGSER